MKYQVYVHRIIEYPKLEGSHKDHGVQFLALHSTTQKSNHVSETNVQTLLEFCQARCRDLGSRLGKGPPRCVAC